MKIIFCLILFIQLCAIISGRRSGKPNLSSDSSISKPRCRRNELFSECGAPCPETCEFLNVACQAHCRSGGACICRDGYVRDDRNKCVRATRYCKRPSKCGQNEVFSKCASLCEPQCNVLTKCREGCEPKCICRDGFIRNSHRECIPDWKCPPPPRPTIHGSVEWNSAEWNSGEPHHSHETEDCEEMCYGDHQVYSKCGPSPACTPTCDQPQVNRIACSAECHKGCYCERGYIFDKFGECVLQNDCPVKNKKCIGVNEIFLSCGTDEGCTPTCDDRKIGVPCNFICVKGCYCKDGYLRNKRGICIPEQNCPVNNNTCSGANEIYLACGLPTECTPTCDDRKSGIPCNKICTKGCYCKDGYIRDSSGICIPEQDCPVNNTCTGMNEIFLNCGTDAGCTPTCDDKKIGVPCTDQCVEGCYCQDGYLRNSSGICIPEQSCPVNNNTCSGANEVYLACGTTTECTPTCDDRKDATTCLSRCTRGCYCQEGYIRDSSGVCIAEEDCPVNNTCTGMNEIFLSCGTGEECTPTCDNREIGVSCTEQCVEGCYCQDGYIRNSIGVCIREQDCPVNNNTCSGANEVYLACGTTTECTPTCDDRKDATTCLSRCTRGCYCQEGYIRDSSGVCIAEEDCPVNNTCTGMNEIFLSCGTNEECTPTCDDRKMGIPCSAQCVEGCYCEDGYLRDSSGVCIAEEDCPVSNPCTGMNEIFLTCGTGEECTPTCENREIGVSCTEQCVEGCYCQDGYIRNSNGVCIREQDCPVNNNTCSGANEIYLACGTTTECTPTCDDRKDATSCLSRCTRGCYCQEGYIRDSSGVCIAEGDCPVSNPCTGMNEIFLTCGTGEECTPTCDNREIGVSCTEQCVEGCFCQDGYIRNSIGVCIREQDCPVNNNTCSGANEVYLACGTTTECTPTCDDRKDATSCLSRCTRGCYCQEGYIRDSSGVCIAEGDCPVSNTCTGMNEIFSSCGTVEECTPTCDDRRIGVTCSAPCVEGCYCEDGYLRDSSGICIPQESCPMSNTTCEGDHKVFSNCSLPAACLPTCENPQNNIVCEAACAPGCICEEGYLINAAGECIDIADCAISTTCNEPNKVFNRCGRPGCMPTCENPNNNQECSTACVPGCYCRRGFLINAAGRCIASRRCPPDGRNSAEAM